MERKIVVFYKDQLRNLCKFEVAISPEHDHSDAILAVKEDLVYNGEWYELPILALINGGKK